MLKDRNHAVSLINTLRAECDNLGVMPEARELENLLRRTRMITSKIFGSESHYFDDLNRVNTITAALGNGKEHLRDILKTMMDDLQLDHLVELQAKTQNSIIEQSAPQLDNEELRKLRAEKESWIRENARLKSSYTEVSEQLKTSVTEFREWLEKHSANEPGSGYIVVQLPNDQKSIFHDLLKGFSDYVRVKGYELTFSFDGSVSRRISFKFAFAEGSVQVSPQQIQEDFSEYMAAVEKGQPIHSLPQSFSLEQQRLFLSMNNKIVALSAECKMHESLALYRHSIIQSLTSGTISIISSQLGMPNPQFLIQAGQANQAVQGSGNTFSGTIHIENTSEGKQTQIQAIENLLAAISKHGQKDDPEVSKSVRSLENVKDELAEKQPDPKRVIGWLETSKYGLKALGLVKEVKDAAIAAYIAFNLIFN